VEEEHGKKERYQLGLLSIQYQLQQKELEIVKIRTLWLLSILVAAFLIFTIIVIFRIRSKRVSRKKNELEQRYKKTTKLLNEQVQEFIKDSHLGAGENGNNRHKSSEFGQRLQEFRAIFRIHHPLVREKLITVHPDITLNDQKHCDFVLAEMTVFQTTKALGVSVDAVKKARKKLRAKFKCATTKELHRYLQKIDDN
jgi:hypothetical protein